jgi:hypothetical protein
VTAALRGLKFRVKSYGGLELDNLGHTKVAEVALGDRGLSTGQIWRATIDSMVLLRPVTILCAKSRPMLV